MQRVHFSYCVVDFDVHEFISHVYINLESFVDTFNVQLLGQILFSQFDYRRFPPSLTWRGKKSCDNNVTMGKCFLLFFTERLFIH